MYGLLKLPASACSVEKERYRRYMCALCGALHKDYGIRARFFVNYDCTTLALLIGVMDKAFDKMILSMPARKVAVCVSKPAKPHRYLRFVSAVSVALAYAKLLDRAIDKGKNIPRWVVRMSVSAFKELSPYGLTESSFSDYLEQQHKLEESGCDDMAALSAVSSEIVSMICGGVADLTDSPQYLDSLKALGAEIGKMVYVLDGVSDYSKDIRRDSFNCIRACYSEDTEKVSEFLNGVRSKIASILNEMQVEGNSLLRRIFSESSKNRVGCNSCNHANLVKQGAYPVFAAITMPQLMATSGAGTPWREICLWQSLGSCPFCLCACCGLLGFGLIAGLGGGDFSSVCNTETPTRVIIVPSKKGCCD